MKHGLLRVITLTTLALASAAAAAQAYRVSNETYGYYYADTNVDLEFNGSITTFSNREYYLFPYAKTTGSNAASVPPAAEFSVIGVGNAAFGLPTVQMDGYVRTTWGANHARFGIAGFDPVTTSFSTTSCPTLPGSGVCTPGLPETTSTYITSPTAYGYGFSRWEEVYQTGGGGGSLGTTFRIQGSLGPQPSTSGTPSGDAYFYWAQRDFAGQALGYVSASYYAAADAWDMSTFSNVNNPLQTATNSSGSGTLLIDQLIDVERSYLVGDAVYVDSYMQTYVFGNGLADFQNTVTLTKLDFPDGARVFASSGTNYGAGGLGLLSFAGGLGSGSNCSDLSCAAGGGGVPPIPEPEVYAMLLAGLALVGVAARRRKAT